MIIPVEVNGKNLDFDVKTSVFNTYINDLRPDNKVAPAHNFLMRSVLPESKEDLCELLKLAGLEIQLAAAVIEEFTPEVEIVVGKSKSSPVQ
ncbi:putative phage tail assembly chaperone [Maridesulfovibrio ferrireducens]|uniref:putative phage tail assembly chaperone n=1 Tax=Maridesulfovibrio ferrireducens TaxID=246191 RepID=UPI001A20352C|nr:putative phage tail assembly chaperone [Maridesulfovibrio ferrireducens]MBI9109910.1 putative phage tail assembly chaperone [Maridesulfovibrio ferrireducens]